MKFSVTISVRLKIHRIIWYIGNSWGNSSFVWLCGFYYEAFQLSLSSLLLLMFFVVLFSIVSTSLVEVRAGLYVSCVRYVLFDVPAHCLKCLFCVSSIQSNANLFSSANTKIFCYSLTMPHPARVTRYMFP